MGEQVLLIKSQKGLRAILNRKYRRRRAVMAERAETRVASEEWREGENTAD